MSENERDPGGDAEAGVEEMEQRSEHVEGLVEEAREDWQRKLSDPEVPGAGGDPDAAHSDDQPETDYPAKGDATTDADRSGADAGGGED